ncbi:phosphatase domain-containing protein [Myxococcota bacterium]
MIGSSIRRALGHVGRYPLSVDDQRDFAEDFTGTVHVWDIDKTYLSTHFSSLEGLARIPMEFAVDKRAIPGMPEILRGLRRGSGKGFACVPLYFVSAGPPQLRKVIERKMLLDGVEHDGIIFKDWLATLRRLRPGRLREQVGFKLCALLTGRQRRPLAKEYLFGDDTESDAEAFHLYARLIAREVAGEQVEAAMADLEVAHDDQRFARALLEQLPEPLGSVGRIFIHLACGTSRQQYDQFEGLVVPVANACELAVALYGLDLVRAEDARMACQQVCVSDPRVDVDELLEEAVDRGLIDQNRAAELAW